MITHREQPPVDDADILAPLDAMRAWERLCARYGRAFTVPIKVLRLKRHKSAVYRLDGVGERGSTVVAKRSMISTARVERDVYERVLPGVPVRPLQYYGYIKEPNGMFGWVFMEDVGDARPTAAHRAAIATWLAQLHTAAASRSNELALPDRGPAYYLDRLRVAQAYLQDLLTGADLPVEDCRVLKRVLEAMGEAESRWDRMCQPCHVAPQTVVHADFIRKNIRVRETGTGPCVFPLDWETAGWGPPTADLADLPHRHRRAAAGRGDPIGERWDGAVPLDVYSSAIAARWPHVGRSDVERLSRVGSVFRLLVAICWAGEELRAGGLQKGMNKMREYAADLPAVVDAAAEA